MITGLPVAKLILVLGSRSCPTKDEKCMTARGWSGAGDSAWGPRGWVRFQIHNLVNRLGTKTVFLRGTHSD